MVTPDFREEAHKMIRTRKSLREEKQKFGKADELKEAQAATRQVMEIRPPPLAAKRHVRPKNAYRNHFIPQRSTQRPLAQLISHTHTQV